MKIRTSIAIATLGVLAASSGMAMASDDRPGAQQPKVPMIVNPALPDICVPPGLVKGQPIPKGWTPPKRWEKPDQCEDLKLLVPAPKPDQPQQSQPQQGQPQQGGQQGGQRDDRPDDDDDRGGQGDETAAGTEEADAPAEAVALDFKPVFFKRVWTGMAAVYDVDDSRAVWQLDVDVERLNGVPRKFRPEAKFLYDFGAYVLVTPTTRVRILNPEEGESYPAERDDIQTDDEIRVKGRFLKQANWRTDDGGDPVPTWRAQSVTIIDDEYTGEDDPADETPADPAP